MRELRIGGVGVIRRLTFFWRRRRVSMVVLLVVAVMFFTQFGFFMFASNGTTSPSNVSQPDWIAPNNNNNNNNNNDKATHNNLRRPEPDRVTTTTTTTTINHPPQKNPTNKQEKVEPKPPSNSHKTVTNAQPQKEDPIDGDTTTEGALAASAQENVEQEVEPIVEFSDVENHDILALLTFVRIPAELQWLHTILQQLRSDSPADRTTSDVLVYCSYCSKSLPELDILERGLSSQFPFLRFLDVCTSDSSRDPFMEMDYIPNLVLRSMKNFSIAVSNSQNTLDAEFFMFLEPGSYPNVLLPQFLRKNVESLRGLATGTRGFSRPSLFTVSALQIELGPPLFFDDISVLTKVGTPSGEKHSSLGNWITEGKVWYWGAKSGLSNYHQQMLPITPRLVVLPADQHPISHNFETKTAVPDTMFFIGHSRAHLRLIMNITNSMVAQYKHEIRTTFRTMLQRLTQQLVDDHIRFRLPDNPRRKLDLKLLAHQFIVYAPRYLNPGVTLATHLTLDRLSVLDLSMSRWKGPVSVAFSVSEEQQCDAVQRFVENHRCKGRTGLHATCLVHTPDFTQLHKPIYPVNWLRNLAAENVDTQLVLILDIDFVVDKDLYDYIISQQEESIESYSWLPLNATDRNLAVQYPAGIDPLSNVNRYAATNYEVTDITSAIGFVYDHGEKPVRRMSIQELLNQSHGRAVFVVPAFEFSRRVIENNLILSQYMERGTRIADVDDEAKTDEMFVQYLEKTVPRTFPGLLQEISAANIEPILISIEPAAHARFIDYPRWLHMNPDRNGRNRTAKFARLPNWPNGNDRKSSKLEELEELTEEVMAYEIGYGFPFEPYVIGSTNHLPFFSTEFEYYGNDKVLYFSRLDAAAFRFYVLPHHFLVHIPHSPAKWADPQIRKQLDKQIQTLTRTFYRELKKMYSKRVIVRQRKPRRTRKA